MLLGVDQGQHVDVVRDLEFGSEAHDLGVDEGTPELPTEGHAMVAVHDEEGAADLIHADGREVAVRVCLAQRSKALFEPRAARAEVAVEVDRAVKRPDDSVNRDLTDPGVALVDEAKSSLDLAEGQQALG